MKDGSEPMKKIGISSSHLRWEKYQGLHNIKDNSKHFYTTMIN